MELKSPSQWGVFDGSKHVKAFQNVSFIHRSSLIIMTLVVKLRTGEECVPADWFIIKVYGLRTGLYVVSSIARRLGIRR